MTGCRVTFEELNLFVDGELGAGAELEMRRHVEVCEPCAERVAALSGLKTAVAASAAPEPLPPAHAHAVRSGTARVRPPRLWRFGVAALATLVVAMLAGAIASRTSFRSSPADPFTTALIADHIHYAHHPERLQVSEADSGALSRWFASRLPFRPSIPHLPDAKVVGGRLCTLKGNRFALAFLDHGGEPISVFVGAASDLTPEARRSWASAAVRRRCHDAMEGYRVCYERRGSQVIAIVAPEDLPPVGVMTGKRWVFDTVARLPEKDVR
jgi:anti-sigma factor RsiW